MESPKVGDRVIVGGDPAKAGFIEGFCINGFSGNKNILVRVDNGRLAQQSPKDLMLEQLVSPRTTVDVLRPR